MEKSKSGTTNYGKDKLLKYKLWKRETLEIKNCGKSKLLKFKK